MSGGSGADEEGKLWAIGAAGGVAALVGTLQEHGDMTMPLALPYDAARWTREGPLDEGEFMRLVEGLDERMREQE